LSGRGPHNQSLHPTAAALLFSGHTISPTAAAGELVRYAQDMKTVCLTIAAIFLLSGCRRSTNSPRVEPEERPKPETKKMLTPGVRDEIAKLVRTGFYDKKRLTQIVGEELYAPGELDPADLESAIDEAVAKHEAAKKTWPAVTDCDRLDAAFAELNKRGIIALHNAGFTQSDGYEDFRAALKKHPKRATVIGYCFYHSQDVEHAVQGEGLYLAFGPARAKEEETKGSEIGRVVRDELERAGLKVEWDGTFNTRMYVPQFVWQKR
jgi:Domain of unknown function (DUF6891)